MSSTKEKKDLALGYALWALSLVGICGVQRMYLGQFGLGVALLFTFGFCGLGQLLDLLLLPDAVKQVNERIGSSSSEAAAPTTPSKAPQVNTASVSSLDADELDQLLHQAKESVSRTKHIIRED